MIRWRVRRGQHGWFTFHYLLGDGREIASYPVPKYWWSVPLYPWFVYQSIQQIRKVRKHA